MSSVGASKTWNITVTQKPRYVFLWSGLPSSTGVAYGAAVIMDVENNNGYVVGRASSGKIAQADTTHYITSVTNSNVAILNNSSNARYFTVAIYY